MTKNTTPDLRAWAAGPVAEGTTQQQLAMTKPSLPTTAAFAFKPGAWNLSPERRIAIGWRLVAASLAGLLCLAATARTPFFHAGTGLREKHGQTQNQR